MAPTRSDGRPLVAPIPTEPNPAPDLVDEGASLAQIERAAGECHACELYAGATQTVFGSGAEDARMMLVGEQPGDVEDEAGEPFVGPAGGVLDSARARAGIPVDAVYVTNIVKHVRTTPGAGKRTDQRPAARHIAACLPWFEAEVERVRPDVIVCLGATASQALLGPDVRVNQEAGFVKEWEGHPVVTTIHPSAALRVPESADRDRLRRQLVDDLRTAWLAGGGGP